jgi:hypothetical protein
MLVLPIAPSVRQKHSNSDCAPATESVECLPTGVSPGQRAELRVLIMQRIAAADPDAPAFIRCVAGYLLHPGFIRGKMFKIQLSLKERGLWEKL